MLTIPITRHTAARVLRFVLATILVLAGAPISRPTAIHAQVITPPSPIDSTLRQIVWAHAPVILQETLPWSNVALYDHLMRIDFDNDHIASNNKAKAQAFAYSHKKPTVYYSVVESADAYYIGYYFYHVTDAGYDTCNISPVNQLTVAVPFGLFQLDIATCGSSGGHENDFEGYWVAVAKSSLHPSKLALVSMTLAHGATLPSYNNLAYAWPGPQTYWSCAEICVESETMLG